MVVPLLADFGFIKRRITLPALWKTKVSMHFRSLISRVILWPNKQHGMLKEQYEKSLFSFLVVPSNTPST